MKNRASLPADQRAADRVTLAAELGCRCSGILLRRQERDILRRLIISGEIPHPNVRIESYECRHRR